MTSARPRLRRALVFTTAIFALLVVGAIAFARGWYVTRRTPAELSALLRPHDTLLKPDGDGPFPAVIMMDGCGGVHAATRAWNRWFRDQGFVSVLVDSHAARGLENKWPQICRGQRLWGRERAGDVLVTLHDLQKLPYVDPKRIVLAGWSHGAWTILDLLALDPPARLPTSLSDAGGNLDGIAGVVLMYPYCGFASLARDRVRLDVPTVMLMAGADTIVPTPACLEMAERWRKEGKDLTTHVYDRLDHAFDQTDLGPRLPHVPWADEDAHRRVAALLERVKLKK